MCFINLKIINKIKDRSVYSETNLVKAEKDVIPISWTWGWGRSKSSKRTWFSELHISWSDDLPNNSLVGQAKFDVQATHVKKFRYTAWIGNVESVVFIIGKEKMVMGKWNSTQLQAASVSKGSHGLQFQTSWNCVSFDFRTNQKV